MIVTASGAFGVASSSDEPISIRAAKVDAARIPIPIPGPIPDACKNGATEPFTPTSIDIQDVRTELPILALARDANDVPGVAPVTAGDAVAWDRPPRGLPPGSSRGNVLLNAHTSFDTTALGNAMLRDVDVGDVIRLSNSETHLCYRVTKRVEVSVHQQYEPFYAEDGPPQFAFIVCSGKRLGPGEWTKRTLWFGSPIGTNVAAW
ncbi:MAG TPA: class F sortase [Aeromicrobium sp.]|nr:class F sortase [Aeromicrobium sp.]